MNDFTDNQVEFVHCRSKRIGDKLGPLSSLQHLLQNLASLPSSMCDAESVGLGGVERVGSSSVKVEWLDECRVGESG